MAKFGFVTLALLMSATSGNPVRKSYGHFNFSRKQVVDFTVDVIEAGKEYMERIEVNEKKQTELFQVPSHPGVDRSDVLHDFKHRLTLLRFPENKICYLFPLVKQQSRPKKLIKDLKRAEKTIITETSREDSTWILDGEVTDRSALGEEADSFCAQYKMYRVKKMQESLRVTEIQTKERGNRIRRRSTSLVDKKLCPGAKDLDQMSAECRDPKLKCSRVGSCFRYAKCFGDTSLHCKDVHYSSSIICCAYTCDDNDRFAVLDDEAADTSGHGSGREVQDEEAASGDPDERSDGSGSFAALRRL